MSTKRRPAGRKIRQLIPAQPGTWALFGEGHEAIELALPVVCWALTEDNDFGEQVEARVADNYGNTCFADSSENFLGIAFCQPGERPPNARTVLLVNDHYHVVDDLKANEGS